MRAGIGCRVLLIGEVLDRQVPNRMQKKITGVEDVTLAGILAVPGGCWGLMNPSLPSEMSSLQYVG